MAFPTPQTAAQTNVCCTMNISPAQLPSLGLPSINAHGALNLQLSFAQPIIGWFQKVKDLLPVPTDPDDFGRFIQKVAQLASQLTLPTMQLETLNSLKFPPTMAIKVGNNWQTVPITSSLDYLNKLKALPSDPRIKINMAIRYPGYSFQPPDLYDTVFAQFTSKFNIFKEKIIGPLKEWPPKLPKVPDINELYQTITQTYSTLNPNIQLPNIPTWQLVSPSYQDRIPAIGIFRINYCQSLFFKTLVQSLVGG